jgi:uncharacterized protein involved in type VI secretion and phage assembly
MRDLYTLTVDGFPSDHFQIHAFSGKEALSEPYAFDLIVTSAATDGEEVERLALGQRAVLSCTVGATPRATDAGLGRRRLGRAGPRVGGEA